MIQFIQNIFDRIFPTHKVSRVSIALRPIRFGSTNDHAHSGPISHKASVGQARSTKKSIASPRMEFLEARATPAHLGGLDIRLGLADSILQPQHNDWLAQPITRTTESAFLNMGVVGSPDGASLSAREIVVQPPAKPKTLDTLLFAGTFDVSHSNIPPLDIFPSAEGFTLSRDELFQTGEWGSENNQRELFGSWTGAQGTLFANNIITHGARTPDALLMASLAVVGVPLLSMGEKSDDHWREILPERRPGIKKGKRAPHRAKAPENGK